MKEKKVGFTLAEILITLSIIGVVAALTIPTLIQRTGNEEAVSRLSKAYSTLSQATEAIMTEKGGVKTWAVSPSAVYDEYKSHLRTAKECKNTTGCFSETNLKHLDGTNSGNWGGRSDIPKLILSDGTQIAFDNNVFTNCDSDGYNGSTQQCTWIHVNVDGKKGPETYGRDVFVFSLKADGLYPAGCDNDDYCVKKDGSFGNGRGCACKVIREGAMNY